MIRVSGTITERDVLRRIAEVPNDLSRVLVEQIMSKQLIVCNPSTHLNEVRSILRDRRIRHLPVVSEDGQLQGVISIGDVNAHLIEDDEVTIRYLHEYLYGTLPRS